MPTIRVGENDEDYSLGDVHRGTAWLSWLWAPWGSTSARIEGSHTGDIDGIDSAIVAPVQTADPDRQGGDRIDLGLGLNLAGTSGWLFGHRIAFEYLLPLHRDLNGPQLETGGTLVVGYQFTIY